MNTAKNTLIAFLIFTSIVSCDAYIQLHYVVENKSDSEVSIRVPNYKIGGQFSGESVDTLLQILPGETVWIGCSLHDVDFPWATKNIYQAHPAVCGIEVHHKDSVSEIPCHSKAWKYKKRQSIYRIK